MFTHKPFYKRSTMDSHQLFQGSHEIRLTNIIMHIILCIEILDALFRGFFQVTNAVQRQGSTSVNNNTPSVDVS